MEGLRLPLRPWLVPVAAAAALTPLYLRFGGNDVAAAVLYHSAALGGTATIVVTVARRRAFGFGWRLLALGFSAWASGDVVWCLHDVLGNSAAPIALEDALYIAAYPFLIGGAIVAPLSRKAGFDTLVRQLLDSGLLFASGFLLLWAFYGDYIVHEHQGFLGVFYPTCDLLLLALVGRFVFDAGRWPASLRLLAGSLLLLLTADLIWRVTLATGSYTVGSWINTLYMDAYLAAAAAVLHPTVAKIEGFGSADWSAGGRTAVRRLGILAAASCVPALLLYFGFSKIDDRTEVIVLAATTAAIPLLALARGADLVRSLRRAAAEANAERRRTEAIVAASPMPVVVFDRALAICEWNDAAERLSGYSREEVLGSSGPVLEWEDSAFMTRVLKDALAGTHADGVEGRLIARTGDRLHVRVSTAALGAGGEIVVLVQDVTSERRQQAELHELAHRDHLTGLPNRRSLEEQIKRVEVAEQGATWLLALDVDNFKSVNDLGGHTLGDEMLRKLGVLLRDQLRGQDFVARLSGDEFAAILTGLSEAHAAEISEHLLEAAREFRLSSGGTTVDMTLSAGLAPVEGTDGVAALAHADAALYEAKRLGKNRLERWSERLDTNHDARKWSPLIKDALRDDRLELFLQPIVPLQGSGPDTYEALCRLRLPDGTLAEAGSFIEAAEELALVSTIDRFMLEKAAGLLAGGEYGRIFVNLSPSSLHSAPLLGWLERTLAELPPQSLGLEITEHAALVRPGRAAVNLARLVDAGAVIAIDDFGLGFTSFRELATLPCHIVKIPAELSRWAGVEGAADAITRAVANVAHAYGKQVVIEGIETEDADRRARALHIEYGQGWYYGRPSPSAKPRLELVAGAA
jgi:diguanylate cyclase (GGDEF)-like protein/PAS domain S-box-containing protein